MARTSRAQRVRSLRQAGDRMRVSFFISVALVPTLLAEVVSGIGPRVSWWVWSILLVVALVAFAAQAYRVEHRRWLRLVGQQANLDPDLAAPVRDLNVITDVVATVHLGKPGPQALDTLLGHLPGLSQVYGVVGGPAGTTDDDRTGQRRELSAMVARASGHRAHAHLLQVIPAWELDGAESERLRRKLEGLRASRAEGQVLVADITGGTAPMSIALYRAAVAAGLPVVYTVTPPPKRPDQDRDLTRVVALHDPDGHLTGAPVLDPILSEVA